MRIHSGIHERVPKLGVPSWGLFYKGSYYLGLILGATPSSETPMRVNFGLLAV